MAAAPILMPLGTTTDLSAPGTWETTRSIIFFLGWLSFYICVRISSLWEDKAKLYGTNLLPYVP